MLLEIEHMALQWVLSVNFAKEDGKTSPFLQFLTTVRSFTRMARSMLVKDRLDIQSHILARLEDEIQH